MNKNVIWLSLFLVFCISIGIFITIFTAKKINPISTLIQLNNKPLIPANTFIEYVDPAGFSFNYPDNLSLEKREIGDTTTYSDIQLFSKDISGSLTLRVEDTKFTTLEDWAKKMGAANDLTSPAKLGTLKALQFKSVDRLYIGAIDQGILFTIEMPLLEEEFWTKVSSKVTTDFAFITPDNSTAQSAAGVESVAFEGEEVVE